MRNRCLTLAALLALVAPFATGSLEAYKRSTVRPGGVPLRRTDFQNIPFVMNNQTAAGMTNADGETWITADSDPLAALRASTEAWSDRPFSAVRFATVQPSPLANAADGNPVFVFLDTPDIRAQVGDALAITSTFFNPQQGEITDSDIIFNPKVTSQGGPASFSTTQAPGSFDLQSTAEHEVGHALGADHTGVLGATMAQSGRTEEIFVRTLTDDDLAFLYHVYPNAEAATALGRITGRVTQTGGGPVLGGLVVAVSPSSGVAVGALTDIQTGAYEIGGMPPGDYLVYAESLNGPVRPVNVSLPDNFVTAPFQTGLFGGNASPAMVNVSAGNASAADIAVAAGEPPLDIQFFGSVTAFGFQAGRGPQELPPGESTDVLMWGPGLDGVVEADVQLLSSAASLRPGSVRVDAGLTVNGFPALRMMVDVAAAAALGEDARAGQAVRGSELATVLIRRAGLAAAYTGALVIEGVGGGPGPGPGPAPVLSAAGVVNTASFLGGSVSPGELLAFFVAGIGPPQVLTLEIDAGGNLARQLGPTRILFDGQPAAMIFTSVNQASAIAPFSIAGRATTSVQIEVNGALSNAVQIAVSAANPGIFSLNQSGTGPGAILNQDFSVNSAQNPESRGRVLQIFMTGGGTTDPPVADGRLVVPPLRFLDALVQVTIGGRDAQVLFGGAAPGLVAGVVQVNAVVPANAPTGPAQQVRVTIGGAPSQPGITAAIN